MLKLARQSAALTQHKLAELLCVDVTTVQGWESGRRPLAATNTGDLLRLAGRLSRLGAPAATERHLLEAIRADQVLSTGITAGPARVDPVHHPLANSVHQWTITNLIVWPTTGKMPQHLTGYASLRPRRGPAPTQPTLGSEERTRFFDHLFATAEHTRDRDEALLRRQAVYLLGFDGRPAVLDWLRAEWRRAGRQKIRQEDVAGLLEARSASVALAAAGDSTHLFDFVDRSTDGPGELANLNYWAHWIGESDGEQVSDAFMLKADTGAWVGVRLLHHLIDRLEPDSPHRPLNLCTLHSLVASRPSLLNGRPAARGSLAGVLDRLASTDGLSRTERTQLAGLHFAVRTAER